MIPEKLSPSPAGCLSQVSYLAVGMNRLLLPSRRFYFGAFGRLRCSPLLSSCRLAKHFSSSNWYLLNKGSNGNEDDDGSSVKSGKPTGGNPSSPKRNGRSVGGRRDRHSNLKQGQELPKVVEENDATSFEVETDKSPRASDYLEEEALAEESTLKGTELQRITIPKVYQQLIAIPLTRRPLFPGFYKSLYIRDPEVIRAVQNRLEARQPYVGIFLAKNNDLEADAITDSSQVYSVGVFAQITNVYFSGPDNEALTVVVYPHRRIKATDFMLERDGTTLYEPYNKELANFKVSLANVENADQLDSKGDQQLIKATMTEMLNVLKEISYINSLLRDQIITFSIQSGGSSFQDPAKLADFGAAVSAGEPEELQAILESKLLEDRLSKTLFVLKKELANAKLQQEISKEVDKKITRKQQEYYLMEQLKRIKKELNLESDGKDKLLEQFRERAKQLTMPEHVKKVFDEEFSKLQHLEASASEFNVTRSYLDWLTQLPWGKHSKETLELKRASEILDEDHYGLKDVKERILEFIAVGQLRGTVQGKILCLVGPPGVGKTSVGKSIARALNREFYRFSVGGLADVAEIKGHRRTYVGAMPGKVIQALKKVQSENPLILIDEIDKLGKGGHQGDPSSALLELLDPEQNSSFLDHYMDVPVDLSKVLFVCTANVLDTLPAPLLDRMEVITLSGYVAEEKAAIAQQYLIPQACKSNGVSAEQVRLAEPGVDLLIKSYCRESGVRNLKKMVDKVYRKAAYKLVKAREDLNSEQPSNSSPKTASETLVIDSANLVEYVGNPIFTSDKLYEDEAPPGVVMGLAWTSMGGSALYIESVIENVVKNGEGSFRQTGKLGDVMKESCFIAYTYVKSLLQQKQMATGFFDTAKIHVHVPEGATPKDGPSAGITLATALISLALKKSVPGNVAMTGELTLTGKVLKIGGLKEKTIAAKRCNVNTIFFPKDNEADWMELPDFIKKDVSPIFVSNYETVFEKLFK